MRFLFKWSGVALVAAAGLMGCAPVISDGLIEASQPPVPFREIQRSPQDHFGKTVVLGGTILAVRREAAATVVEILERPLGSSLQPQENDRSGGRFLARLDEGWVDVPLEPKRRITVAGKIAAVETHPLDQTTYSYPVIEVEEFHLWPERGKGPPPFTLNFGISGTL